MIFIAVYCGNIPFLFTTSEYPLNNLYQSAKNVKKLKLKLSNNER